MKVHAANIHDTKGGCEVFDRAKEKFPTIKGFSADEGYRGTSTDHVEKERGLKMEISKKIKDEWAILAIKMGCGENFRLDQQFQKNG